MVFGLVLCGVLADLMRTRNELSSPADTRRSFAVNVAIPLRRVVSTTLCSLYEFLKMLPGNLVVDPRVMNP